MVDLSLLQSVSYIAGALGVCVAAFYYVMTLRISQKNQEVMLKNQTQTLEARRADLTARYMAFISSKEISVAYLSLATQQFNSFKEWQEKYGHKDRDAYISLTVCMNMLNGYGILYENKTMTIDEIEKQMGVITILSVWPKGKLVIDGWREMYNEPTHFQPAEHLAGAVMVRHPNFKYARNY